MASKRLTTRQASYLENIPTSKTKKEAALKSGYSENSSRIPTVIEKNIIENSQNNGLRFQLEQEFNNSVVIKKFHQLLHAQRTVCVNNTIEYIDDNITQLNTLKLILSLKGELTEIVKPQIQTDAPITVNITYSNLTE